MRTLFILLVLLAPITLHAQSEWSWINPRPTGNALHDVLFMTSTDGVAVGERGTILRTSDAGASWQLVTSVTDDDLFSVSFADPVHGIAVGYRGTVLRSDDGGRNWRREDSIHDANLADVAFGPNNVAIAIDRRMGRLLRSTDGGGSWLAVPGMSDRHWGLGGVEFVGHSMVLVGGYHTIYASSDAGISWRIQADSLDGPVVAFSAFDSLHIAAASDHRFNAYYTSNGGSDWIERGDPSFGDSATGVALVSDSLMFVLTAHGGYLSRSTDRGASWDTVRLGEYDPNAYYTRSFSGIAFASETTGVVVCLSGDIYRTTDGGLSWSNLKQRLMSDSLLDEDLRGVAFFGENGIAVGEEGAILRSSDDGRTWTIIASPTTRDLNDVAFFDRDRATIVADAGLVLNSSDGGTTWDAVQAADDSVDLYGLAVTDAGMAIVVGRYNTILRTDDAGRSWQRSHYDTANLARYDQLFDVDIIDSRRVIAVGSGGQLFRSDDGGRSWSDTLLKQGRLAAVDFADSLNGTIVWTVSSGYPDGSAALFVTSDGGSTWQEKVNLHEEYLWYQDRFDRIADVHYLPTGGAVALGNISYATNNRGGAWKRGTSPPHALMAFAFTADGSVIGVGGRGTILRAGRSGISAIRFEHWLVREMMLR